MNLYLTSDEARAEARKRGLVDRQGGSLALDTILRKLAREETYVCLLRCDDGTKLYRGTLDGKVRVRTFAPGSPDALWHWTEARLYREERARLAALARAFAAIAA